MQAVSQEPPPVPDFGEQIICNSCIRLDILEYVLVLISMVLSGQNFCPPIYPFGNQLLEFAAGIPLFSLHCLQITPSPSPPKFASKTVITCQPLTVCHLYITLVEHVCLAFSS